jgi:predicted house-cleaning noncanonical NTP pyrophosphatase (MazG superfamily)
MGNKFVKSRLSFKPVTPLVLISDKDIIQQIPPKSITLELVGKKAFGLSCLPKSWTLPFIVVSDKLLPLWISNSAENRTKIIEEWSKSIFRSSVLVGMKEDDQIIVRSSGRSEGLDERGMFYSTKGTLKDIKKPLIECLEKISSDKNLNRQQVPLIIQKYPSMILAKGHLSNERRCSEETRDWLGEFEELKSEGGKPFKISLRDWRKKISTEDRIDKLLKCNLTAHVSEVLRIPATWGYERKLRLHYEWVWDGSILYLVQADPAHETDGVNPHAVCKFHKKSLIKFIPKCLKKINKNQAKKYYKIRNVFTYLDLGLQTIKLYALDDQSVISDLASGKLPASLKQDLSVLVKGSLVIRMDIVTDDQEKRQLLPRTHEVRELSEAVDWLKKKSAEIKNEEVVFIFHNFIPAVSSAFAYAAPGKRQVQIEALWGLPEGLYYNKHDKFIVDTRIINLKKAHPKDIAKFKVQKKINYKHFFVSPDENGQWTTKIIKPPYDRHMSISRLDFLKNIAFESRRIAEKENKPISIMWFVGVPKSVCSSPILPWYHEPCDLKAINRALTHRTKTPFDRSLIIRTSADIDMLRKEAETKDSSVRRIRIQPQEEKLLRDKDTLRKIGELAQKINAIILLEGGVLSHAYYQLMETNAIVEVLDPFDDFEEQQEFNKLVRDKVPYNIEHGGEIVNKVQISGEELIKALSEKLIEESFEVLDAIDQDAIINELADVMEVVDGVISQLKVSREELKEKQNQKRKKAGGFNRGFILSKTENPLPSKRQIDTDTPLFGSQDSKKQVKPKINAQEILRLGHAVDKWSDRREHKKATETILKLLVPMIRNDWKEDTLELVIDLEGVIVKTKVKIEGKRLGSKLQISLSVFNPQQQLKFF